MTPSQTIYLAAVGVYILFFLLFGRFFIWKRYADGRYWRRRPKLSLDSVRALARERGRELPFFSVIVPARNEAEVIGRTIDHLIRLRYDPQRFEVVVATDEKEALARDRRRLEVLAGAAALLDRAPEPVGAPSSRAGRLRADVSRDGSLDEADEVILALLARLAVTDYVAGRREYRRLTLHMTQELGEPELAPPMTRHVTAVTTLAHRLAVRRRPLTLGELRRVARLAVPQLNRAEADLVASVHLALAVPVAVAYGLVTGRPESFQPARIVGRTGQAREEVTARVLTVMSALIARTLAARVEAESQAGRLGEALGQAFNQRFPTTQDVVEEKIAALRGSTERSPAGGRVARSRRPRGGR